MAYVPYSCPNYDMEYEIPQQRTHCHKCGSFLPIEPTRVPDIYWLIVEWKDVTLDNGQPYQVPEERLATQDEIDNSKAFRGGTIGDAEWDCPKCGYTYSSDEMFD